MFYDTDEKDLKGIHFYERTKRKISFSYISVLKITITFSVIPHFVAVICFKHFVQNAYSKYITKNRKAATLLLNLCLFRIKE